MKNISDLEQTVRLGFALLCVVQELQDICFTDTNALHAVDGELRLQKARQSLFTRTLRPLNGVIR